MIFFPDTLVYFKDIFNTIFFQIYFGIWVTLCVTASWVGTTHSIKYLYLRRPYDEEVDDTVLLPHDTSGINMTILQTRYVSINYLLEN